MDAFHTGDIFWVLALTLPVLMLLLILCTDCQDSELDTTSEEEHTYKPSASARTQTFGLLRHPLSECPETRLTTHAASTWSAGQSQSNFQSRSPLYSPSYQAASAIKADDDTDSVPSYENQGPACITDDDDTDGNYDRPYLDVLPEPPPTDQGNNYGGSSDSIVEQYENVLETRQSPGEYVNVLEPEPTVCDIFTGVSDQESEDDTPEYENVCPGL